MTSTIAHPSASAEKSASAIGVAVLDYGELNALAIPELKRILAWLKEGGLAMAYAPRGVGKTMFGLSLAASIVSGKKFMRWEIEQPCGVLYIDGEMPLADYRERLKSFMLLEPKHPLFTLSHETFYQKIERDLVLTDPPFQMSLLAFLDSNSTIRVLIVDNLSSVTRIREDKGDDWRESMLPFLLQCRRRGIAVLLVHHAGKNGDQRGTGAREDHLDVSIRLSVADHDHKDGAYFRVDFTKARGVYGDTVKPFTAKLTKGEDSLFTWMLTDVEEDTDTRLLNLIKETGGISVTDAAEALQLSKSTISKAKKRLEEKKQIKLKGASVHSPMEAL